MDSHSLTVLEFNKIRKFLSSYAGSAGGKRLCTKLVPEYERSSVTTLLQETSEMRHALRLEGPLRFGGVHEITLFVERSTIQNFYLDQEALLQIRETLETAETAYKYFGPLAENCPLLHKHSRRIVPLYTLTDRIAKSISGSGEILDSASPELAAIRNRLRKLRTGIIRSLEKIITDHDLSYAIQDDFITQRNNRYVIPVRTDSKSTIPGVVHDQSQSKATFFIEPLPVVTLNNEFQLLQKDEYYEEIRILTELTRTINEYRVTILDNLNILEALDLIAARALFSTALNAIEPELSADGTIEMHNCRHPILMSRFIEDELPDAETENRNPDIPAPPTGHWEFYRDNAIPIDLIKAVDTHTLIITGANAGGKTVALKTLGLLVLMNQAGIHIPVEKKSRIALFDTVFADIGDEQNIESSLSTFSAHMSQIKNIVSGARPASLVLLDELGSGTDPAEGGGLAIGTLDFLRRIGCFTIITTHLNILKTYAYNNTDVENVSVEFDPETLRPNFRLIYGVPGLSNALAIARNIGLPDEILQAAETYIDRKDRQIGELIHGLEKTQQHLSAERRGFRKLMEKTLSLHKSADGLVAAMQSRKLKILKKFEEDARRLLRESENQLTKLLREQKRRKIIRPDDTPSGTEKTKNTFSAIKQRLQSRFPAKDAPPETVKQLEPGQTVTVIGLKKRGVVIAADNRTQKADIDVGTMRIKASYHDLTNAQAAQRRTPQKREPAQAAPAASRQPAASKRLNVIGMRVDDALPVIDKALDRALMQGTETIEIIHGRGTGKLRQAIHEFLAEHHLVTSYDTAAADEGGSGVTLATIKI
ncbi:MAG: endonuclease MutS2 [Deltaproteobacteria bacterium]|nr:endonuclease MutS2 [Deltaproteobacteria bacterium]